MMMKKRRRRLHVCDEHANLLNFALRKLRLAENDNLRSQTEVFERQIRKKLYLMNLN